MSNLQETARKALRGALDVRKRVSVSVSQAICIYDTAEQLGIEVIFRPENSLGGIYNKTAETILIPTRRPPGRQAFTCAHEIGHWFFGHGTGIDEISDLERFDKTDPNERLVDIFASYLLMPPWAVREAYDKRKWKINTCTPKQAYTVGWSAGCRVRNARTAPPSLAQFDFITPRRTATEDYTQAIASFDTWERLHPASCDSGRFLEPRCSRLRGRRCRYYSRKYESRGRKRG